MNRKYVITAAALLATAGLGIALGPSMASASAPHAKPVAAVQTSTALLGTRTS
jgi:hypothetical protein